MTHAPRLKAEFLEGFDGALAGHNAEMRRIVKDAQDVQAHVLGRVRDDAHHGSHARLPYQVHHMANVRQTVHMYGFQAVQVRQQAKAR